MRVRALTTAAWVSISVLVGHLGAYRITYNDPHARAHVLESSGHGWTGYLPVLLVAAVLGAVVGTLTCALATRRAHSDAPRGRTHELLVLGIGGTLAYSLVEIGERVLHHGDLSGVLHDLSGGGYNTLLIGVLFILATAPLLLLVRRGIEALVSDVTRSVHGTSVIRGPIDAAFVHKLLFGLEPNRGPPNTWLG